MSDAKIRLFERQNYLNLKTFRKNGAGVPTPVWFVEHEGLLYVWTLNDSGKVKRIRNNGYVKVAPCNARGGLLGDWLDAQANLVSDQATIQAVNRLLDQKYGLQRSLFNLLGRSHKQDRVILAIKLA